MKLSLAQIKVLANLNAGRDAFEHIRGQSQHGGADSTVRFLIKHELVFWFMGELKISDKGKFVYQENVA